MRIAVFGATGSVGQHLVPQALEQGLEVTALARTPEKIGREHDRLFVLKGDIEDAEVVSRTVEGQDAIICLLGAPILDKSGIRTTGTRRIIAAMKAARVRRLVCLSSIGAGESYALLPGLYKYLIAPLMMERLFADHEAQEAAVSTSGLDWVVARPGNYTDGEHTGRYHHGPGREPPGRRLRFKISRSDVADFVLSQLSDTPYLNRAAWLSY